MAEARFRKAAAADCGAIADLVNRAYAGYVPRMGRKPAPMTDDHAAEIAAGETLLLEEEEGGRILGVLVLRDEGETLLLHNVAVEPAVKGRGLGRRLLERAEQEARARACSAIRLYTHATMIENIAIYRRLGYVESGRRTDDGFDRVFMRKALV